MLRHEKVPRHELVLWMAQAAVAIGGPVHPRLGVKLNARLAVEYRKQARKAEQDNG